MQRSTASIRLWDEIQQDNVTLYLPAICVIEAIRRLDEESRKRRELVRRLDAYKTDVKRMPAFDQAIQHISDVQDELSITEGPFEQHFWSTLERTTGKAIVIDVDREFVSMAGVVRDQVGLTPADSSVLAAVLLAKRDKKTNCFLSANYTDFDKPDVQQLLKEQEIRYFRNADEFLNAT